MKKTVVKVLSYLLLTTTGVAAGWGGNYAVQQLAQPDDMAVVEAVSVQPQIDTQTVELRVRGGQMEWFDGVRWNTAAPVEELQQNDPLETRSDAWYALAQQRADAKETQRQESLAGFDREQTDLTVGEKPVVRQPTATRQPSASTTPAAPAAPSATPPATPQTPSSGGDTSEPAKEWTDDYE